MGYLRALWYYLNTGKARRDLADYIRAAVVIGAIMAMVRIIWDMVFTMRW